MNAKEVRVRAEKKNDVQISSGRTKERKEGRTSDGESESETLFIFVFFGTHRATSTVFAHLDIE